MKFAKRIALFVLLNFLVIAMISFVLNLFNIRPYLNAYGIDLKSLAIFCAIWGMGGALISLLLSRVMAKWMMGVRVIDPHRPHGSEKHLLDTVHELARAANLTHMPEVGIFQSPEVNAFATGPSESRALVAVSSGLLNRMAEQDVRAVLAHEISHIVNGDMVTMTLLQGVINAFVMFLARIFAYAISGLGRSRNTNNSTGSYGTFIALTYLFEITFMILGSLVTCAYSRAREYRADAGGARLAGQYNMISALESLRALQQIRDPKTESPAMAAFKISHPAKRGLLHLFATHPTLDDRIERLKQS